MAAYRDILRQIRALITPGRSDRTKPYLGIIPGGYGDGDLYLGVSVPDIRKLAKKLGEIPLPTLEKLMTSPYHEARFLAVIVLVDCYKKAKTSEEEERVILFYLNHLDHVNNWDLVDSSAPYLLGDYLRERSHELLFRLYDSEELWRQRTAIVSTLYWPKKGYFETGLALCAKAATHPHHLIHKAAGWVLRELGKADENILLNFLETHAPGMPRVMLAYAMEKLTVYQRRHFRVLK